MEHIISRLFLFWASSNSNCNQFISIEIYKSICRNNHANIKNRPSKFKISILFRQENLSKERRNIKLPARAQDKAVLRAIVNARLEFPPLRTIRDAWCRTLADDRIIIKANVVDRIKLHYIHNMVDRIPVKTDKFWGHKMP